MKWNFKSMVLVVEWS